jgi:hypothetical protein
MICPNCGHDNNDKLHFCVRCGTRIKEKAAEPAEPTNAIVITPAGSGYDIPLHFDGFEKRDLTIRTSFWRQPKLFIDGTVVKRKKRVFTVRNNSGEEVKIEMKLNPFDPIPRLKVNGTAFQIFPPLKWHEYAWVSLPVALIIIGGAIGGMFAVAGAHANFRVFRSSQSVARKYGISFLITITAFVLWYSTATQAYQFVRQFIPLSAQISQQTGDKASEAEHVFLQSQGSTTSTKGKLLASRTWMTVSALNPNNIEQKSDFVLNSTWKFNSDGTFSKIFRDGSSLPGKWKLRSDERTLFILANGELGTADITELTPAKFQMKIGGLTVTHRPE